MLARRIDPPAVSPPAPAPLALVVFEDDDAGARATQTLRERGYRTFAIDATCGDVESLDGLRPAVIVLDVRRAALRASKLLVELSKRESSPPVLLLTDGDDALWIAARFGLLPVALDAGEDELMRVVDLTRREQRRPRAPR